MNAVHYSSATDEWATPNDFYAALDAEFHFTLDPCCTDDNAKCVKHYTKEQDGLSQDWGTERVFCNPPYGRTIPLWIAKCSEHGARGGNCGNADPSEDRHKGISRVHLQQGRNPVYSGSLKIRGREKQRAFSVHGRDIWE